MIQPKNQRFLPLLSPSPAQSDDAGTADGPPLAALPAPAAGEAQVLQRWRRAREEAMQLWAVELLGLG